MSSQGAAGPGRKTTWRSDVAEGWRLFRPYALDVLTPARRAVLIGGSSSVGVAVSAAVDLALHVELGEPHLTLTALIAGLSAAILTAWIAMIVWRPRLDSSLKFAVPGFAPGDNAQSISKRIRTAWVKGAEPDATISQRLAAARAAERIQAVGPSIVFMNIALPLFAVPFALVQVTFWPLITIWVFAFGLLNGVVQTLSTLASLGLSVSALATEPSQPDHLEAGGQKRRLPYRVLGTDHPDDYT